MARTGPNIKRSGYSPVGPAFAEQMVVLGEMFPGLSAGENQADHHEFFARPAERLAARHSVPPLDHPGPGSPEIHKYPAARQQIERCCGDGCGGRSAGSHAVAILLGIDDERP
jgi:hypothetical protein